jgi:hypothetical protein
MTSSSPVNKKSWGICIFSREAQAPALKAFAKPQLRDWLLPSAVMGEQLFLRGTPHFFPGCSVS